MVGPDCETVDRAAPGTGPPPEETPPVVAVSGKKLQRPLRAKRLVVAASSSKAGRVTAYGEVTVFNLRYRLPAVTRSVSAGRQVTFSAKIGPNVLRELKDAFKRRSRVSALVRVRAFDVFGNRSPFRLVRIRLAR
jgi:hypothetical protein